MLQKIITAFAEKGKVEIDGKPLTSSQYTATSGSLQLTLTEAYMKTLSTGNHNIVVRFEDGTATSTFQVTNKPKPTPKPAVIVPVLATDTK